MDALDPWKLAELYGIDVIPLSTLTVNSAVRDHFNVTARKRSRVPWCPSVTGR